MPAWTLSTVLLVLSTLTLWSKTACSQDRSVRLLFGAEQVPESASETTEPPVDEARSLLLSWGVGANAIFHNPTGTLPPAGGMTLEGILHLEGGFGFVEVLLGLDLPFRHKIGSGPAGEAEGVFFEPRLSLQYGRRFRTLTVAAEASFTPQFVFAEGRAPDGEEGEQIIVTPRFGLAVVLRLRVLGPLHLTTKIGGSVGSTPQRVRVQGQEVGELGAIRAEGAFGLAVFF